MGRVVYAKNTTQKMELSVKDFFSKCDLRFTEEILNGKLHFLCKESLIRRELIHRETQYRQKKDTYYRRCCHALQRLVSIFPD